MQIVSNNMETALRPNLMSSYLGLSFPPSQRLLTPSEGSNSPPPSHISSSSKILTKDSPQELNCPLCSIMLHSQKDFTAHIRGHNEVKPLPDPNDPTGQAKVYYCCLCKKMLSSFSSLDRHMLVHSGERPFSCEKCGQTFTTNGNMHRHKRTHGNRDSHDSDGSSGTTTRSTVGRPPKNGPGRKKKNPTQILMEDSLLAKEKMSEEVIPSSNDFFKSEFPPSSLQHSSPFLPSHLPSAPLSCPVCKLTLFNEFTLETHINLSHPGVEVPCDECNSSFSTYYLLKLHKDLSHHKSLFSLATQLKKVAAQQQEQQQQQQQLALSSPPSSDKKSSDSDVSPMKLMVSSSCSSPYEKFPASSKDSDSASNQDFSEQMLDENDPLIRDMKMRGEFPCRLCTAVYPNLRALKGHNKEHLVKPPYVCNVGNCIYSSNDKSTLARHMRGHTGEKPFECKICHFGFTTKANCERHVKNKHSKSNRDDIHIEKRRLDEESEDSEKGRKAPPVFFAPYHSSLFRSANTTDEEKSSPEKSSDNEECANEKRPAVKNEIPLDLSRPPKKMRLNESAFFPFKQEQQQKVEDFFQNGPKGEQTTNTPQPPIPPQFPPLFFPQLMNSNFDFTTFFLAQQEILRRQAAYAATSSQAAAAANPGLLFKHLLNLQKPTTASPLLSPPSQSGDKTQQVEEEDDYKLVIKDGVLMKKQKQKRYRKERPYACDICEAKFTLRSNMERHIKNQHSKGEGNEEEILDEEEEEESINVIDDEEELADEEEVPPTHNSTNHHLLSCPYCEEKFTWISTLKEHLTSPPCNKGGPFKCGECPSWFNNRANRDKHVGSRHSNNNNNKGEDLQSEEEGLLISVESATPFKCHLCEDGSFPERGEALVHLQISHAKEYKDLLSKGVFESALNENNESTEANIDEEFHLRGKFPDYGNRKIICLFCLRKFWSAEDLRRHVRTHTGERPYSCEICQKRFSLKHSMLRHRKKHDSCGGSSDSDSDNGTRSPTSHANPCVA